MFCSKCGKTIHMADAVCPNCQAPIGDNRFAGNQYTSAQFTIAPGQKTFEALNNYTRTTYTSMPDAAQENTEVDSRTTYRPVYEGASAPEDVRRDMRAAVAGPQEEEPETEEIEMQDEAAMGPAADVDPQEAPTFIPGVPLSRAAQETLNELDEELKPEEEIDLSQFKSRPITSAGRAGISRDVSEYIRKLEDGQGRRGARRRAAAPVYDDYAEQNEETQAADDGFAPAPDYGDVDADTISSDAYGDFDDNYDEDYGDTYDEDYDDDDYRPRFGVGQIIKIVIALALVAALAVGGVAWVRHIRSNQSSAPIEGVSESVYTEGIALIKRHVEPTFIDSMIATYTGDGGVLAMSHSFDQNRADIQALLPEEPMPNDQTFINALLAIEDNVFNAVTMDAISVNNPSETAVEDSEARWAIVSNSITQLEGATSAAELTAIINGQTITVQTQTPAPTAEPITYKSLVKGDENKDVLNLQNRLHELGYLTGNRDSVFGSKTQTAVKYFQETAGLQVSGIADNETQQLLFSDDAPYAPGATTPAPTSTPAPTPEPTTEAIAPAEAGADAA